MNVGELRKAIEGADDRLDIVPRTTVETEDGDVDYCCTIATAEVQYSHLDDEPYFAVDGEYQPMDDIGGL